MINFFLKSFLFNFINKKFIAAVSGGPDSMWMLNKYKRKIIAVAFVNYNKRNDTWYEEKIVNEFCIKNNIDFFLLNVDWSKEKKYNDNNFQSYARKLRYDFFCDVSNKINNNNLLVAHNFNDFLETAYSQKQKKSASLIYGINQNSNYKNLKIFRPLLYKKKIKIEKLCIKHKVKYNIDYTNKLDNYERNRNRKIILNMNKKKYYKFILEIFFHNSKNFFKFKKINHFYNQWVKSNYDVNFFNKINNKYKFYLIYLFLSNNNFKKISSFKINGLIDFITIKSNKKYRISNDRYIYIKKNLLMF